MTLRSSELALLGGPPAFSEPVHVGRPNIGDRDRLAARMADMLDRRWLTNSGPYVEQFEQHLSELCGVPHVVATCNATIALELVIRAMGLTGEVIVPSFTFVATAHAVHWHGLTPVFCDVDPVTHNIDPAAVERLVSDRTSAIVGVHLWGRPCDVEALETVARRRNLALIFDAAHALGCSHRGAMIGCFGDAEVFSFHATKFVNSFEGGAVATNDADLAERLRLMRNFGFTGYDHVESAGTNGKMSEASGAMGLTSLESIDRFVDVNRRNHEKYAAHFNEMGGISLASYPAGERSNFQYVVIEVDSARTGLERDALQRVLHAENVFARRYFFPGCHRMEPYRTLYPDAARTLPATERLASRVLALPTGTAVEPADVDRICGLIAAAVDRAGEVRERLGAPSTAARA